MHRVRPSSANGVRLLSPWASAAHVPPCAEDEPADLGAGWFEGLASKNRYALIARLSLWKHLDNYLSTLDDLQFRRALVFLRRAFSGFTPAEKSDIAENLGEIWGVNQVQAAEVLMGTLSQSEQESLKSLEDFDFDDI